MMLPLLRIGVLALLYMSATASHAQSVDLSLQSDGSLSLSVIQLFLAISVLSIAPGIVISLTCFPFVVTVLSILRQAIGLQQAPPNMLIVILSVFISYFVMAPVLNSSWEAVNVSIEEDNVDYADLISNAYQPFKEFMESRLDPEDYLVVAQQGEPQSGLRPTEPHVLIPSFLISEVSRAFQVGFLVYIPFLIIDLVVAAVLMSMGMMMVPPAVVSLPFKLAFFVVADGWLLITQALIGSYG